MPRVHELKTLPDYFEAVAQGDKKFEVRRNDRGFQAGDSVILRENDPRAVNDPYREWLEGYSGRTIHARISYVLAGGAFGIQAGHCVLALTDVKVRNDD